MNKSDNPISHSKFVTPIFLLAMGVLLVISLFAYQSSVEVNRNQEKIMRSYQVKADLYFLFNRLIESKASLVDYLLTDRGEALMRYEDSEQALQKAIAKLEQSPQSTAQQAQKLSDLLWATRAATYSLEDAMMIDATTDEGEYTLQKKIKASSVLLRSVKSIVSEMVISEDQYIRELRLQHIRNSSLSPFSSFLLILFALLALVLFYYQINENFQYLKRANRELELRNQELSSFNHVTSHDLQEPLRKIEMFISRLVDKDGDKLSEQGKQYLEKINFSAGNMRKLIQDLLLFSQLDLVKNQIERISLDAQLRNSIAELEEDIAEKNGVVNIRTELPEMEGISFQIGQLFTNLLCNALKYSKKDTSPIIEIDYDLYEPKADEKNRLTEKQYHRITIADNGIGFSAEYTDKIFEVFERLHSKNEYTGSGIGLAICKKIMENHGGAISSESSVGKGSSFYLYFPVRKGIIE